MKILEQAIELREEMARARARFDGCNNSWSAAHYADQADDAQQQLDALAPLVELAEAVVALQAENATLSKRVNVLEKAICAGTPADWAGKDWR